MHNYDAYDGVNQFSKGRRTVMIDASGNTKWLFDVRGRVTKETKTIGGTGGGTFVTEWSYDAADRVKTMKYPGGNNSQTGETVNHVYTPQGLLDTVIGSATYVGDTRYNALGQVTQRNLGSAAGVIQQHYNYTAAENFRLVSQQAGTVSPYNNRQNIAYAYDNTGNVLSISDAAAYGGSQTQTFSYDDLDRLSTAQASGSTTYGGYSTKSYGYNHAGNITSFEGTAFTYQDTAHKHAVTHLGGTQKYWYDANGNATRRINFGLDVTYTYDAENRLTGVSGGKSATFTYDGDGRLVKTQVGSTYVAIAGAHYQYSGSTGTKYYYAGNVRVAERVGGTLYYLFTDHLNSTALTTDSAGNRKAELRYYPYGKPRYNWGGQKSDYRFTGQRWQGDIGLYYYNARWYDHLIGRFTQPDTIVPQPGNPMSLNRYMYVRGNPILYTDPTGHRVSDGCEYEGCGSDLRSPMYYTPFWTMSSPAPPAAINPGGDYGEGSIAWGGQGVSVYLPPSVYAYADDSYTRESRCRGQACWDSFTTGDYWWGEDWGNTCVDAYQRQFGPISRGTWEVVHITSISAIAFNGRFSLNEYAAGIASGRHYEIESLPPTPGEMGMRPGQISGAVDALNIMGGALQGLVAMIHDDSYFLQRNSVGSYRVIVISVYETNAMCD